MKSSSLLGKSNLVYENQKQLLFELDLSNNQSLSWDVQNLSSLEMFKKNLSF